MIVRVERAVAKTLIEATEELGHVFELLENFRRGAQQSALIRAGIVGHARRTGGGDDVPKRPAACDGPALREGDSLPLERVSDHSARRLEVPRRRCHGMAGFVAGLRQREPCELGRRVSRVHQLSQRATEPESSAASVMRHALAEGWTSIYDVLTSNPAFGREVVGEAAGYASIHSDCITSGLGEEDSAKFLVWLETEFPQFKDPELLQTRAVGVRDQVAELRTAVVRDPTTRGTIAALRVLRETEQANAGTSYLRWAVLEAEHHTLSRTWTPIVPSELRALARDASRRLVRDEDALLEVVVESLRRLSTQLQGQLRTAQFLWDRQMAGTFMPVDENALSDFVRLHLETDVARSGIVLNREVQLRPSVGPATGERTDIHVDALSRDPARRSYDRLTIVVETKGAWNAGLFSAMKTQLKDRYPSGTGVRRGVYLVGWFASAMWTDADRRCVAIPSAGMADSTHRLVAQATELSTGGTRIESVMLDATFPGAREQNTPRPARRRRQRTP